MNICIFGDSVTFAGYIKNSWANLFRWHLESLSGDYFEVFNLGVSGDTSDDIMARFMNEASAREPEKIIFAFGVNDSAYLISDNSPIVTEENFIANINNLITYARECTENISFIGPVLGDDQLLKPFPGSSTGKAFDHERVQRYDAMLKQETEENDCQYIHLYDALEKNDFEDGLHPNEAGHQKMFRIIMDQIVL